MKENFGGLLKEKRVAQGMTLSVFAEVTGLSATMISNFEHNRARPTEKVLNQLCNRLSVTESEKMEFFSLSKTPPPVPTPTTYVPLHGNQRIALRTVKDSQNYGKEWVIAYRSSPPMGVEGV